MMKVLMTTMLRNHLAYKMQCINDKSVNEDKSDESLDIPDGDKTSPGSLQCGHFIRSATFAGLSKSKLSSRLAIRPDFDQN